MLQNSPNFQNFQISKFLDFKKYSEIRGATRISDAFIPSLDSFLCQKNARWTRVNQNSFVNSATIENSGQIFLHQREGSKMFKLNLTLWPWIWIKRTESIILANKCWQHYQIKLVFIQKYYIGCAIHPKHCRRHSRPRVLCLQLELPFWLQWICIHLSDLLP